MAKSRTSPIVPVSRDQALPLSFAQERFWILDQLDQGNSAYLMTRVLRLTGSLNPTALEHSLNVIVARHESLRTTFPVVGDHPVQHIASSHKVTLPVIDLQDDQPSVQRQIIQDRINQDNSNPVDLAVGPLFRFSLLQIAPEEHVFIHTLHHIISDGWSRGVLYRELSHVYNSFLKGESPSRLPIAPVQYVDFAVWQRQWMQGERLEKELDYWKTRLAGTSILKLPTDRPRPPLQTFNGEFHSFSLSEPLTKNLKTVSRQARCTLFVTLLAAFKILLHRYADQDDIVVASPIAGRNPKVLEDSFGLFIHTLVFRSNLSGNPTFHELLQQVRRDAFSAYEHHVIPFEELMDQLKIERNPSYPPIFQVLFTLENLPQSELTLSEVTASPYGPSPGRAILDIALTLREVGGQLMGYVRYNADLFHPSTISGMFDHFATLLQGTCDDLHRRIHDLPLISEPEREQMLVKRVTAKQSPYPEQTVVQLFERQVILTPDATALRVDATGFSYAHLNAKANQLARVLRKLGVHPEVPVGIYLKQSPEMFIALWAILKSGGAYVPLNPDYPAERIRFILQDANISVVLTHGSLERELNSFEGLSVVNLDTDRSKILREDQSNLSQSTGLDSLAYVLYSSGTTGQPKGIMVPHGALTNFVQTASSDFLFTPKDQVLQFASIGFDVSVEEIFPCLTNGGTLILRTENMLDSWKAFLEFCQEHQITILDLPTSFLQALITGIEEEGLSLPPSVRLVIMGGEHAYPKMLSQWNTVIDNSVQLVNAYGPTETTVNATYWTCEWNDSRPLSIGRPIQNLQAYVLDRYLRPVPVGIPGELCIAGAGLARGYLHHPQNSAVKFIPNPFLPQCSPRLYLTGDRARQLPDGTLEFLGRKDHQVKVRGYRIELGEIETVLCQQPDVKEAVVVTREESSGRLQLVAYVVPEENDLSLNDLHLRVKQRLPHYMVPAVITVTRAFPLTPNGKVDRSQLPEPDWSTAKETHVGPRTPMEEIIIMVWQEVLQIENIGIHDNFFELGGHSLLATKTIARIRVLLNQDIQLRTFFQNPTVAQLATQVE